MVVCVLGPRGVENEARQVRAEVTSERDVRAQRDVLLADMMVDALVTSALNPYWLWGSVGAPPAYCRYLGPAPLTLLDWFRNVGVKLLPPSVNRGLGLKFEAASAAAPPRGLSPAGAEARGRAAAQLRRRNQGFCLLLLAFIERRDLSGEIGAVPGLRPNSAPSPIQA